MLKKILFCLLIALISGSSMAWSKAFIWIDDEGVQYATDKEESIPEKYRDRGKIILAPVGRDFEPGDAPNSTVVNFARKKKTIVIAGFLNGNYPVEFLLDTGSTDVLITEEDARVLGLDLTHADKVKVKLADGKLIEAPRITLGSVRVGNAEVKNIPVVIGKIRLLGLSFLNKFKVVIDLEKSKVTLSGY